MGGGGGGLRKIAKRNYIRHITFAMCVRPSFRLSVWNDSALTGRISTKFDIRVFFENLSIKI